MAASVALALCGCDQLFNIDTVSLGDAHVAIDAPGCWDAAYQGNEDKDAFVDGCDNCPLDDNVDQLDTDDDKIGDACDPHPTQPRERRVFFDPMSEITSGWLFYGSNPSWQSITIAGGGVRQADAGDNNVVETVLVYQTMTFEQPTVELTMFLADPDDDLSDPSKAGLYLVTDTSQIPPPTPNGVLCGLEFPDVTRAGDQAHAQIKVGGSITEAVMNPTVGVSPTKIKLTTDGDRLAIDDNVPVCSIARESGTTPTQLTKAIKPTKVRVALYTLNASATFTGIDVLERVP